ncbi:MAG: HAD family phosphatase [Bacteroidaceae bacterium]|nr:HAD family phosphatase [Bacteroidaceae bacterium]
MLTAALFDLDGVIFDTEPQYTKFWGSEFQRYYPDEPGLEQAIKGQTLTQIYDRYFVGALMGEREAITSRLNDYERRMSFPYIAGVQEFIISLHQRGLHTAVVTSSNHEKMARVYEQHPEFKGLFDAILTSEDFLHSKPHPDCYLRAMARFGATPNEAVVFEDSINGLRSGRDSGALVVALTTSHSAEKLKALSDYQIPDFTNFSLEKL